MGRTGRVLAGGDAEHLCGVALEEEGHGEAVELVVARLGDFSVDGGELGVCAQPLADALAEELPVSRHRRAEDLHR